MNSTLLLTNFWRFVALVLVQGLILKQIPLATSEWMMIYIYPLFIFFLPLEMPTFFVVGLGFLCGLFVDFFYGTPGLHASAGTWSGAIRGIAVRVFQPRGGFSGKEIIPSAEYFGLRGYLQMAGLFFFLHLFWYFAADEFTFYYFGKILLKSLIAWLMSMIFVLIYALVLNPKR